MRRLWVTYDSKHGWMMHYRRPARGVKGWWKRRNAWRIPYPPAGLITPCSGGETRLWVAEDVEATWRPIMEVKRSKGS